MSTVPRALRRARLWTAGLMTASTVLVGAIGIHLADAQTRPVATRTSFGTSASSSSSGFGAVSPVGGSNAQAQTNSGGS
jgi:hypothetical protein